MDWSPLHERLQLLRQRLQQASRQWLQGLRPHWLSLQESVQTALRRSLAVQQRLWEALRQRPLPQAPPPAARLLVERWHKVECWVAVIAFGFIATILVLDVLGREFLGPFLRFLGFEPGATGIFFSQKLSIFALVIGSFAGIGIATATGAHIVPTFASGWVPAEWQRAYDRATDLLTGVFLVGVAWFGFKLVGSSFKTDLRAPVIDWAVWPIQLAIPLGFLSAAGRYLIFAAWPALRPVPPEFQE